jgi:predicted ribosomally synthesized peptide with nif11-like leader
VSVESAIAYITRMREDQEFHRTVAENSDDEAASWALVKASGYDFTIEEFKEAQDAVYQQHGITPM